MRKTEKKGLKLRFGLVLLLVCFLVPLPALAYIDPSVSSYLIQAVAGAAVALGAFLSLYGRRALKALRRRSGPGRGAKKEREEDVRVFDP